VRLLLASAALLAACGPSSEAVEREKVLHAIEALRAAPPEPPERRRDLLMALEREPASSPGAARARGACASAYRLLLDGTALEKTVQLALEKDEPPTAALAQKLIDAEAKIKKSKQLMLDCEEAVADLRLSAEKR
jgi:hypothetical protein